MTMYAGRRLKMRCPRCKGNSFELFETYEEAVAFTVEAGVMPESATDHIPGSIIGLSAKCHTWRQTGAMAARRHATGQLGAPDEAVPWRRDYIAARRIEQRIEQPNS